jgi:hypothetical protein
VVVGFRISGKGRRLFGDGLAVWIAQPYRTHDAAWDDDFYGDEQYTVDDTARHAIELQVAFVLKLLLFV